MSAAAILVVDDNALNLKLTRTLLASCGYQVQTAGDAYEALAILAGFRPALVLLDLQMPGMDGFELARRLRADPATADIPLVALTGFAMKGDEERARAAGCDGYITKPIDTRLLPEQVAGYLAAPPRRRPAE